MKGINLTQRKEEISELKYKRNLDSYATFEIGTENENFDNILSINPLNELIKDDFAETIDCVGGHSWRFHAGIWSHQYTDYDEIYFNERNNYEATDLAKRYLKEFFTEVQKDGNIHTECRVPIAFEFIKKGCRKPYDVIALERKK